jgi:ferredoxin--NADP+ reductase
MYKIVTRKEISQKIKSYDIHAPEVAKAAKAGQFVILRIDEKGERVPLTIAGTNPEKGLVRVIFQEIGKTTMHLASLCEGDYIRDFLGPLGNPTKIKRYGTIVTVAGGVGVAEIIPVIKELRRVGNKVITVVGARCKDLIILGDELKEESDLLFFATNDGTCGIKGFVTDVLKDVLAREKVNMVYAIGPVPMMKAVAELTKEKYIETLVSLNSIMLDGTGMCGACRITVNGRTKFVCVDGPDFNAHLVNWEEITLRLGIFKSFEKISIDKFKNDRNCKCHKE